MSNNKGVLKIVGYFDDVLSVLLVGLMTLVAGMVFVQVLLRYVFRAPLMGIEELLLFPTTWLYIVGAIKASSERTQIVARVLEIFIKQQKYVHLLRAGAALCSGVVILWLTRWGYDYLLYTLRIGKESPTMYIPLFYAEGMIFIGMVMMCLYTILECAEELHMFRQIPLGQINKEVL